MIESILEERRLLLAKILIADDETTIRTLICKIVKKMGHTPVEAGDGREALKKFEEESVDLSIVDVKMPEIDGIGYLERVKKESPHAVVIMMTAYPSAETIIKTIEDNGYTYIAKPLQVDRIMDLIKRGLECWEARLRGEEV